MENTVKLSGHDLKLNCREKGSMTGIEKVVSSNETAISLISTCGNITISGEKLRITKYDCVSGTLEFEGQVREIKYTGAKQSLLKRLFK